MGAYLVVYLLFGIQLMMNFVCFIMDLRQTKDVFSLRNFYEIKRLITIIKLLIVFSSKR